MTQKIEPFVHTDAEDPEARFVTRDMRPLEYIGYSERLDRHIFVTEDNGTMFAATEDYILTVRDVPPMVGYIVRCDDERRVVGWIFNSRQEAKSWIDLNGRRGYTIGEVSW